MKVSETEKSNEEILFGENNGKEKSEESEVNPKSAMSFGQLEE